ncbi:MAG: PRC-barrel domain-containing protein, partial [Burkholderiaceae bacterium]|nr:PRC-barrel domain-containing protein [Burkholderiaceae bacterium]
PTGTPMTDGVGPGAYSLRADVPDKTLEGTARIVPLRADSAFDVAREDIDPRGLPVLGADGQQGGVVTDLWVDRSEMLFRYLEVKTGDGDGARSVLLPMTMAVIGDRAVEVSSILGSQFGAVPGT